MYSIFYRCGDGRERLRCVDEAGFRRALAGIAEAGCRVEFIHDDVLPREPWLADYVLALLHYAGRPLRLYQVVRLLSVFAMLAGLEDELEVYDTGKGPWSTEVETTVYELVYTGYLESTKRGYALTEAKGVDEARCAAAVIEAWSSDEAKLLKRLAEKTRRMNRAQFNAFIEKLRPVRAATHV
ncbi:hypothetical protein Pdsh_06955 [Pyrodictium delaneyi]|uniref:Uncharacterized protein n=1 Tax=Pyrodictium delaneyi TaxID=1273541 RepID=A0A211YMF3_9CREN|nr:hypothetical protein Pdsh_06955 [Pyrodictium delaneyi]